MVLPEGKPWKRSLTGSGGPAAARAAAFERLMKTSQSKHNIKTLLAALHHLECKSLCSARPWRSVADESVLSSNTDLTTLFPPPQTFIFTFPPKKSLVVGGRLAWGCTCEMALAFFSSWDFYTQIKCPCCTEERAGSLCCSFCIIRF